MSDFASIKSLRNLNFSLYAFVPEAESNNEWLYWFKNGRSINAFKAVGQDLLSVRGMPLSLCINYLQNNPAELPLKQWQPWNISKSCWWSSSHSASLHLALLALEQAFVIRHWVTTHTDKFMRWNIWMTIRPQTIRPRSHYLLLKTPRIKTAECEGVSLLVETARAM